MKFITFSFIFASLFAFEVRAQNAEAFCEKRRQAAISGSTNQNGNQTSVNLEYQNCVKNYNPLQDPANAPKNPGEVPVNECAPLAQNSVDAFNSCQKSYDEKMAVYQAEKAAYDHFMAGTNNVQNGATATQVLAELKNDLLKAIQNTRNTMRTINQIVAYLGALAAVLAATLIGAAAAAIAAASAAALALIVTFIGNNHIKKLEKQLITTCVSYNRVATVPINCETVAAPPVSSAVAGDTLSLGAASNATIDWKPWFDPATGQCRKSAPAECADIAKRATPACFKTGGACMASKETAFQTNANGTITGNLNGKKVSLKLDDFKDEASMISAGFTAAQAKAFTTGENNPFDLLKRKGLDAKGDLRNLTKESSYPSYSGTSSNGPSEMIPRSPSKMTGPAESGYLAVPPRETASVSEGITKEFRGDQLGLDNDNLFKMMNRRYNLKRQQNIFFNPDGAGSNQ